jgi:hypothetical protein
MLGIDAHRLASVRLLADNVVPPFVARRVHRHCACRALVDDDVLHLLAAAHGKGFVDHGLQRDLAAAAELAIRRHHGDGTRVNDAFLQRLRREAAEHHRVRRTDARAGLHGHHHLNRHRHVDQHAIAELDPKGFERICHAAYLAMQVAVADLRHLAVIGLEDDRDLVALRLQMPVETVVRGVQLAIVEPAEERRLRLIEHFAEGLRPVQRLAREACPEAFEVALGFGDELAIGLHAGDVRLLHKRGRRRENAVFLQYRFNRRRHCSSCVAQCLGIESPN